MRLHMRKIQALSRRLAKSENLRGMSPSGTLDSIDVIPIKVDNATEKTYAHSEPISPGILSPSRSESRLSTKKKRTRFIIFDERSQELKEIEPKDSL